MSMLFVVSYAMLWLIALALAAAVFALYYHFGRIYLNDSENRQDQGPAPGSSLRDFAVNTIDGRIVGINGRGQPALIVFTSVSCQPCASLRPYLSEFADAHPNVDVFVICSGNNEEVSGWSAELRDAVQVVVDEQGEIARKMQVDFTPVCVAVDADGEVTAGAVVGSLGGLEQLLGTAEHQIHREELMPTARTNRRK